MYDHIEIPVADLDRARLFYDAALTPLGIVCDVDIPHNPPEERGLLGYYGETGPAFSLLGGGPVIGCVQLVFAAPDCAAVAAFRLAGLAAGGSEASHGSGLPVVGTPLCRAALFDPDGHRIEAVCAAVP